MAAYGSIWRMTLTETDDRLGDCVGGDLYGTSWNFPSLHESPREALTSDLTLHLVGSLWDDLSTCLYRGLTVSLIDADRG